MEMARDSICSAEVLKQEEKSLEGSKMWKIMLGGQFIYGIGSACVGPFGVRVGHGHITSYRIGVCSWDQLGQGRVKRPVQNKNKTKQ